MDHLDARPQLIVGTSGHIDHGKSRLVWTLTGVDPDRLPEEKARGMTIDLGFAHAEIDGCDVWFVDVPGHERFIRNMVAGASGVDAALLVVAADDSVMPQTREHAEVLSWLGLEQCVVVLTKMDLVDEEWADQVAQEAADLLASVRLRPVAVVRTSAVTGRGHDELRAVLARLARERTRRAPAAQWFRLPIDRAFIVPGRGVVVTGSVWHGDARRDDELQLWPSGRSVRVRDLQSHNVGREAAAGRMRLAVNLAGVSLEEVSRGDELATPGYLEPTTRMNVWLASLRMPGQQRRARLRVRLHLATRDVLAELRLLSAPDDELVKDVFAQVRVAGPIVAEWGQRFIVRDEAASRTLGGGVVLQPIARTWTARRPADAESLRVLQRGDPRQRLEFCLRTAAWETVGERALAARAGLSGDRQATDLLRAMSSAGVVRLLEGGGERLYAHADLLAEVARDTAARLKAHLEANPRLPGLARSEWPGWMPRACPAKLRPALAEHLIAGGAVALADGYIVPKGHAGAMSPEDQALYDAILAEFERAGLQPPGLKELKCLTPKNEKRVGQLVHLAATRGRLVRVADGMWLHERPHGELVRAVVQSLHGKPEMTVAELRTVLNSTRKYVVPFLEHLDAIGVTKRSGDVRTLGAKAPA